MYASWFYSVFCCPVKHSVSCQPEFFLPSFFVWTLEIFVVFLIWWKYSRLNTDSGLLANQSRYSFKYTGKLADFEVLKLLQLHFLSGLTTNKKFNQNWNVINSPSELVNISTDTHSFSWFYCTCHVNVAWNWLTVRVL